MDLRLLYSELPPLERIQALRALYDDLYVEYKRAVVEAARDDVASVTDIAKAAGVSRHSVYNFMAESD